MGFSYGEALGLLGADNYKINWGGFSLAGV